MLTTRQVYRGAVGSVHRLMRTLYLFKFNQVRLSGRRVHWSPCGDGCSVFASGCRPDTLSAQSTRSSGSPLVYHTLSALSSPNFHFARCQTFKGRPLFRGHLDSTTYPPECQPLSRTFFGSRPGWSSRADDVQVSRWSVSGGRVAPCLTGKAIIPRPRQSVKGFFQFF